MTDSSLFTLVANLVTEPVPLADLLTNNTVPGWTVAPSDGEISTTLPGVDGFVVTAERPGAPSVSALSFALDDPRAFEDTVADAATVLGAPMTVLGGPAVRWYRPPLCVELVSARRLELYVTPWPEGEYEELHAFEFGRYLDLPYRWRLDAVDRLPTGYEFPAGPVPDTLAEFETGWRELLLSWQQVAELLPVTVGTIVWVLGSIDHSEWFTQGWFSGTETLVEVAGRPTQGPTSAAAAEDIATRAMDAVRSWPVSAPDDLEISAFADDRPLTLTLTGLGLRHAPGS